MKAVAPTPARGHEEMTIAEVAVATKTSAHTLRYYERIGLIVSVRRARSGHRRYGPEDVRWVEFLRKLHRTGMPIRRMLAYAALQRQGDATISARKELLEEHRADVRAKVAEQQTHLAFIEAKIRMYEEGERTRAKAAGAKSTKGRASKRRPSGPPAARGRVAPATPVL